MSITNSKAKVVALMAAVACLIFALALVGCSADQTKSSTSSTSRTKLIVGFDQSYPPYGFIGDDGEYTGFDLDLAKEVCEKQGWTLELKAIDWDAKDALLEQGQINCIWNGFTMEGREGKYAFSEPYMLNRQVIVVKDDSSISSFDDLKGRVVITQADSAALEVLQGDKKAVADTFARLDTISDYNNAFMQLDSGAVDAVACDMSIAFYQFVANPNKYETLDTPLSDENYAVGFKNDEEGIKLAEEVTKSMRELYDSGKVEELCKKYEAYGLSFDNWELK